MITASRRSRSRARRGRAGADGVFGDWPGDHLCWAGSSDVLSIPSPPARPDGGVDADGGSSGTRGNGAGDGLGMVVATTGGRRNRQQFDYAVQAGSAPEATHGGLGVSSSARRGFAPGTLAAAEAVADGSGRPTVDELVVRLAHPGLADGVDVAPAAAAELVAGPRTETETSRGVEPDGLPTAGSGSPDERVKGSGCLRRAPRRGRPAARCSR